MMLPSDQFKAGLTAFLCAHLLYISAFLSFIDIIHWWLPLILFLIGAYLIYRLYPGLGSQIIPVTIYTAVILIMFWNAAEVSLNNPHSGAWFLLIGAFLFTLSDFILALNRFQKSFSSAQALNLVAYFTAQILIASSIGRLVK